MSNMLFCNALNAFRTSCLFIFRVIYSVPVDFRTAITIIHNPDFHVITAIWWLPWKWTMAQTLTDQITHVYRVLCSTGWITDIFVMKLLSVIYIKEVYLFSYSIFLHCLLSFGQQQKLKDTAFGCICTVMQLFTVHTNCFLLFSYYSAHPKYVSGRVTYSMSHDGLMWT